MRAHESTITVHFWNLAAYTNGQLVGDWVDLDQCKDLDDFEAKVKAVTKGAEELLVSASECDFGITFSEYSDLGSIWEAHSALLEILEDERDAFAEYLAYIGGVESLDECVRSWRDAYCGRFNSIEEYAWSFAEDCYPDLANVPPGFRVEVDTATWESDHWISATGNVFRSI
ncbi:antirestriction protein ArdA [Streptosporangium sp. NPDC002524]|uniref:antirestriction protein ArdA n=1 Tax=Streptosporangium sp. NPDC002524 TaxID=3154537 RepID=UPI00332D9E0B